MHLLYWSRLTIFYFFILSGCILVLNFHIQGRAFYTSLYTSVHLSERLLYVSVAEFQRTQKCQPTQEILHISEVIEQTNWISCYSQHGDLHEVDKSLGWWLL